MISNRVLCRIFKKKLDDSINFGAPSLSSKMDGWKYPSTKSKNSSSVRSHPPFLLHPSEILCLASGSDQLWWTSPQPNICYPTTFPRTRRALSPICPCNRRLIPCWPLGPFEAKPKVGGPLCKLMNYNCWLLLPAIDPLGLSLPMCYPIGSFHLRLQFLLRSTWLLPWILPSN